MKPCPTQNLFLKHARITSDLRVLTCTLVSCYPQISVPIPTPYLPAAFSLTATGVWGTSDFLGGIGARRANAFVFTAIVHASGMLMIAGLAVALGLPFPRTVSVGWALIAGGIGGIALAIFYRALAIGQMGLAAPLAAVLGAGIPTMVSAFAEGFPGKRHILGFLLAGLGVWLISRSESVSQEKASDSAQRPRGLGLALLSGCGFACFYLCIRQAGQGSALWLAVCSRFASLVVTLAIVLIARQQSAITRAVFGIAFAAGILDITGTIVFVRASQLGRLDTPVVLSSLYPAVTVILARIFLREHFSRARTIGMLAALAAVPMIAG
jgi:drug/metabolite transporter (DMT)-like permease